MSETVTNAELKVDLDSIRADLSHMKHDLDTALMVVVGNGKPKEGLAHRVAILETVCERMERLVWLLAASTIAAVIGAVFATIKAVG